jgi:pantoate--beta-alanine ligase
VSVILARTVAEIRNHVDAYRKAGESVSLVPTMGALHAGHASLIERARSQGGRVVVSVFVNPLQFGPAEDYLRYPRPIEKDLDVCERMGADLVFAPEVDDIYLSEQRTFVEVTRLGDHLCGPFRPGHFRGVATIVAKLFNIVRADRAFFGEKDYQQLCIIRRMVDDLNIGIEIVPVPTFRDADGLALSSRNAYLDAEERAAAPVLYRALTASRAMIEGGERSAQIVREAAVWMLGAEERVRTEYFEIVDAMELQPMSAISGTVRLAGAIWIGKTRLIDNVAAVSPV